MFICTYLFPLPSHSVNMRCKIWQATAAGDCHLFCSDSPPPVMTCKWCAPTISCYSWMDFGDALSCLPAAANKGGDNLRSCSTPSDFGSDSVYFLFLSSPTAYPPHSSFQKLRGHTTRSLSTSAVRSRSQSDFSPFWQLLDSSDSWNYLSNEWANILDRVQDFYLIKYVITVEMYTPQGWFIDTAANLPH